MPKTDALTLEQAMVGVLAMLAAERDDQSNPARRPEDRRKTEIILADAGLTPAQIGQILGKKANTVAKTLQRARKRPANEEGENDE
jgi:DNA-directed RNA polymerase specialized sigma24 family protein